MTDRDGRGWELALLAVAARRLVAANNAAGPVGHRRPPEVRAAVAAIAARLQAAGVPAGLADAAVTGWFLMGEHWNVAEAVARVVAGYPTG